MFFFFYYVVRNGLMMVCVRVFLFIFVHTILFIFVYMDSTMDIKSSYITEKSTNEAARTKSLFC